MRSEVSSSLLSKVETALLAEEPDAAALREELSKELEVAPELADNLLYTLVRQLNSLLFPPITQIELVHTEGCNLACSYCFERNMLGYRRLPPEIARLAVNLLFDYSGDESTLSVTHFGGEPTLNFDGIRAATEYAEQKSQATGKHVRFDMTSNGVLLREEMVSYFAEHKIHVLLSIDGLEESHDRFRVNKGGHGTFKRVINGLQALKQQQPWIGVKMTVMPQNAASLVHDVLGLYDLGVNQFIIGHATGVDWPEEDVKTFVDQLRELREDYDRSRRDDLRIDEFEMSDEQPFFGCQAGRNSIAVSVTGELSPCSKIMGFNSKRLVSKLGDVWHGVTHLMNRQELISCNRVRSACERLGIAQDYHGGCFAVNYGETGDLFVPSVIEHTFEGLKRSACAGCPSARH